MGRAINIAIYKPKAGDRIVVDTNILVNVLWPVYSGNSFKYQTIWEKLINSDNVELLLSSIQISEFINRCIRLQFELYKDSHSTADKFGFKSDYRGTEDYCQTMSAILEIVKGDILPRFTCINDKFDEINKDELLSLGFSYDFNDGMLAQLAKREKAYMLTDDKDFLNFAQSLNIITGNPLLLKAK